MELLIAIWFNIVMAMVVLFLLGIFFRIGDVRETVEEIKRICKYSITKPK